MKEGRIAEGRQCGHCGRYDTLIVVSFYPATLIDPESASGFCEACDDEWDY